MPLDPVNSAYLSHLGFNFSQVREVLGPSLPRLIGTAPGAAAGANNGSSPPAPTVVAGSTDGRGSVQFGSGTTPAIGEQVVVTFSQPYGAPPVVTLSGGNAATSALGALYPAAVDANGFRVRCTVAPTASQGGSTFLVQYTVHP
jgi:hypothetical protein